MPLSLQFDLVSRQELAFLGTLAVVSLMLADASRTLPVCFPAVCAWSLTSCTVLSRFHQSIHMPSAQHMYCLMFVYVPD